MSFDTQTRFETGSTANPAERLSSFVLLRLMHCIVLGQITVFTPSGACLSQAGKKPGPTATLVIHRWRAIRRLITGGDIGFAESYVDGDWSSPDLIALIELGAVNRDHFGTTMAGLFPIRAINHLRHLLNPNTRAGSRRNIGSHYDLGNDFYRLWLDESMSYSAALFAHPMQSLEAAQEAKAARIIELLDLRRGDQVLEIGFGWGALASSLARAGAHVTGITLSAEQLSYAQALVAEQGKTENVQLSLQDYRESGGQFDRIVSIEMLEAVGERYWQTYFDILRARLKPGGRIVLQVITIDERRFERYRKKADFIQRHIFPGGMLPSKTILAEFAARNGFGWTPAAAFGGDYAVTLAEWRRRFLASWPAIEKLGFTLSFRRMWEYYLCYCEVGFRIGAIDVGLYVLEG